MIGDWLAILHLACCPGSSIIFGVCLFPESAFMVLADGAAESRCNDANIGSKTKWNFQSSVFIFKHSGCHVIRWWEIFHVHGSYPNFQTVNAMGAGRSDKPLKKHFFFIWCFLIGLILWLSGSEPLYVHTSDLHAASFIHGTCSCPHDASLPASSQQHPRLCAPPWAAIHRWHRRHPGVHGRAYRWHKASWSPHGP